MIENNYGKFNGSGTCVNGDKALSLYLKAFVQDTKCHHSIINRWCTMPFGVHHPLIHIPYIHSYQVSMKSPEALQRYGSGHKSAEKTNGQKGGWTDRQCQSNIPLPMAWGRTEGRTDRKTDRQTMPKQYPSAYGVG
ncbi:hypothetical protein DPMN_081981 [Dreissena polymorpha]|uniref:Uncharacterized protein n=1 Tax=Dreissena polymorpha TaxID=45954 RepID=A0A9D3Y7A8_DREPO|nr:hypothetical protein DPMN_081981 [Dreissena polymorpha]